MEKSSVDFCTINKSQGLYQDHEMIICFMMLIICWLITVFIGLSSIKQFRKLKKLQPVFKYTFHAIWIIHSFGLLLFFVSLFLCVLSDDDIIFAVIFSIGRLCYFIGAELMLMILLFRLYFTFKNSMYEISKSTKLVFITLSCCIILVLMVYAFLSIYAVFNGDLFTWNSNISVYISVMIYLMGTLYIGTTIAAIKVFANKLMAFTELRANSIHPEMFENEAFEDVKLNANQMQMIENTTRYVSLLFLGIISTFLLMIISSIYSNAYSDEYKFGYFAFIYIRTALDIVLNTICLYLQHSFGIDKYMKYCKVIHLLWRFLLTQKATKSLETRYKKIMDEYYLNNANQDNVENDIGGNAKLKSVDIMNEETDTESGDEINIKQTKL